MIILQEQLSAMNIPSLSPHSFVQFERDLGTAFEALITQELITAGKEEYEHAITTNCTVNEKPTCTVVVDDGWSKCTQAFIQCQAWCGVIFGAHSP